MKKIFNLTLMFAMLAIATVSCKKESLIYEGPSLVHFTSSGTTFFVTPESDKVEIPVGITKSVDQDVTIKVKIGEGSTAEEGVHFTIDSKEVTISSGEVIQSFVVRPIYENLGTPANLILEIEESSNNAAFTQTYSLRLQQFCKFNAEEFAGTFLWSSPEFWGDEYEIDVIVNPDNENSLIMVDPYQPEGVGYNVTLIMNDDDPNNIFLTIPEGASAWYSANYSEDVKIYGGKGTFNTCEGRISYEGTHRISLGSFGLDEVTLTKID